MIDSNGADEGSSLTARVTSLERWREAVDHERGTIMRDLGSIDSSITAIKESNSEMKTLVEDRFNEMRDLIEERPSRTELDRDMASIRAKSKGPVQVLSELEIHVGKHKFRLLGPGVTIVFALATIVLGLLLYFKK